MLSGIVLYGNTVQILPNKSYGPMHYTIGVTCVYYRHVSYTCIIHLIHNSTVRVTNVRVSGQCVYILVWFYD